MGVPCEKVAEADKGQIAEYTDELDSKLSNLHELILKLAGRTQSVRVVVPPETSPVKEMPPNLCEYAQTLCKEVQMVSDIAKEVRYMLDTIQL